MKIFANNQIQTPQFKAVKVAQADTILKGSPAKIEVYRLTKSDNKFLHKFMSDTSFSELFPKLSTLLQERWQKIFNYCVTQAMEYSDNTYLTICNHKPCGIMTYYNNGNGLYLDGICSIPIEKNQKVPNIGKSLFCQLFRDAKQCRAKNITLSAVQDGPFDVVKKYENMGFKKDITTYPYTDMKCNKYSIAEQNVKLQKETHYTTCDEVVVNLKDVIN